MSRLARRSLIAGGVLVSLAAVFLVPAAGDWLVTRDGGRVETDGPWRVESRLVVFKQKDGTLGSLRLSDVDLEASRRLTEEMAARAAAPPEEPEAAPERRAVIRLTEEDLPPAPPLPAKPEADAEGAEAPGSAAEQQASSLEIVSFREAPVDGGDGIAFVGTLRNSSENTAIGVGVTAILFDEEGEEIGRNAGQLTAGALRAGESAGFRVDFPAVYHYVRAQFDVEGDLLRTRSPEEMEAVVPGEDAAPEEIAEPPGQR